MGMRRLVPVVAIATALSAIPATATAEPKPSVTHDCTSTARRPASVAFACGSGGYDGTELSWRHWGQERAVGRGLFSFNDCDPDCATGTLRHRRGRIRLLEPTSCGDGGEVVFSRAHVRYDRAWQGHRKQVLLLGCPL